MTREEKRNRRLNRILPPLLERRTFIHSLPLLPFLFPTGASAQKTLAAGDWPALITKITSIDTAPKALTLAYVLFKTVAIGQVDGSGVPSVEEDGQYDTSADFVGNIHMNLGHHAPKSDDGLNPSNGNFSPSGGIPRTAREWLVWRLYGNFQTMFSANTWPRDADYVLFNTIKMGIVAGGETSQKVQAKHAAKGFWRVQKKVVYPPDWATMKANDKSGNLKIFGGWCEL
jgi:hypothetical protein